MYDCIIIGGGPAGLTCAIYLARFKRNTLLIEDGKYRNYASPGIHGFLGYDGIKPVELLKQGRAEASKYNVNFKKGTVTRVIRKKGFFEVLADKESVKTKKVVLAYGVKDDLPGIKGFKKFYGKNIHHCPVCDGYEVKGKRVGVIGLIDKVFEMAVELKQWTNNITVLTNGHPEGMDRIKISKLAKSGIIVTNEKISFLKGKENLESIVLMNGNSIDIEAIFFSNKIENSCKIAEDLKCSLTQKHNKVIVNKNCESSVRGVFAIGDLLSGPQLVVTACSEGALAAIEINRQLLKEILE